MARIIARMIIRDTVATGTFFPTRNLSYRVIISLGNVEMMLNRRTMEIPFPTPRSVIRSPIHISIALPDVIVAIATITLTALKSIRRPLPPNPTDMAIDCIRARPTVR